MKKGKILKIEIIIFVLLLAIIVIGIGSTYIKDRKEEKKLINEFDEIYGLINNEKIEFSSINKKLDEVFLTLIHNVEIRDKDFLSLTIEDPFFNRMTSITDVL